MVDHLLMIQNSAGICAVDGDLGDGGDVLPGSRMHVLGRSLVRTSRRLSRSAQMVRGGEIPWSMLVTLSHALLVNVAHQQHIGGHSVVVMVNDSVNSGVLGHILVGLDRSGMGQKSLGEGRLQNILFVPVEMVDRGLDGDLGASRHGGRRVERPTEGQRHFQAEGCEMCRDVKLCTQFG